MKLGKRPYRHDERTLNLDAYLNLPAINAPSRCVRSNLVPSWPMYLNDSLGDCTCAEVGHAEQLWSTMNGAEVTVPDQAVETLYEQVSGYDPETGDDDNGAAILDVMKAWKATGCGGHKIGAFAQVDINHDSLLRAAIWLFGGVSVGLQLPLELQAKVDSTATWHRPALLHGANAPGSWGGHCVLVCDYDTEGLVCVTWGRVQRMSWAFWHAYGDEAWAAIPAEWFTAKTPPTGVALAALEADLKEVAA